MNETIKTLLERRSIRSFKSEQVKNDDLDLILKAGTYAPTARGTQAPVIVVVQDAETIAEMEKLNAEVMGNPEARPFYGAPTVIVVFSDTRLTNNAFQDGSLVLGNLMNAAFSLGVDSCWINRATETFKTPAGIELMKKWGLDENYIGIGNCILGYRDCELPEAKPRKDGYIIRT